MGFGDAANANVGRKAPRSLANVEVRLAYSFLCLSHAGF